MPPLEPDNELDIGASIPPLESNDETNAMATMTVIPPLESFNKSYYDTEFTDLDTDLDTGLDTELSSETIPSLNYDSGENSITSVQLIAPRAVDIPPWIVSILLVQTTLVGKKRLDLIKYLELLNSDNQILANCIFKLRCNKFLDWQNKRKLLEQITILNLHIFNQTFKFDYDASLFEIHIMDRNPQTLSILQQDNTMIFIPTASL